MLVFLFVCVFLPLSRVSDNYRLITYSELLAEKKCRCVAAGKPPKYIFLRKTTTPHKIMEEMSR